MKAPALVVLVLTAANWGASALGASPAASQELVVSAPVEKSELHVSPREKLVDTSSLAFRASAWSANLPSAGTLSSPLFAFGGRFPMAQTALGILSLEAGASYARFSRVARLQAGIHLAQASSVIHWFGLPVGAHLDLTPALRVLDPARISVGTTLTVMPGYISASDSLAGPAMSRFDAPLMPSLEVGWYPLHSLPIAFELQGFATAAITEGLSGYGGGLGLRYCPERGEL